MTPNYWAVTCHKRTECHGEFWSDRGAMVHLVERYRDGQTLCGSVMRGGHWLPTNYKQPACVNEWLDDDGRENPSHMKLCKRCISRLRCEVQGDW